MLAGDFNQLPPGDDPKRLGEDEEYYAPTSPIANLLAKQKSAMDIKKWEADPTAFNTYLPFGAKLPDRVLDWMFVSKNAEIRNFEVHQHHPYVELASDHLPLSMEVVL
jgi:endonuclease/exonuclease/phosphatase family metal-dependent hydrolase